jgi:hypothetical protein
VIEWNRDPKSGYYNAAKHAEPMSPGQFKALFDNEPHLSAEIIAVRYMCYLQSWEKYHADT